MTHTYTTPAELQRENAALRRQNTELHRRLQRTYALIRNPNLPTGQRVTAVETLNELDAARNQADPTGAIPIVVSRIAAITGQSPDSVSSHLKALEQCGAWTRSTRTVYDAKIGGPRTEVRLTPTPALEQPGDLMPPTAKNWGGKRVQCPDCHSERLIMRSQIICEDCGVVVRERQRSLGPAHSTAKEPQDAASCTSVAAPSPSPTKEPQGAAPCTPPTASALSAPKEPQDAALYIPINNQRGGGIASQRATPPTGLWRLQAMAGDTSKCRRPATPSTGGGAVQCRQG